MCGAADNLPTEAVSLLAFGAWELQRQINQGVGSKLRLAGFQKRAVETDVAGLAAPESAVAMIQHGLKSYADSRCVTAF